MDIFTMPDFLLKKDRDRAVQVFDYWNSSELDKGKVLLKSNVFSFLQEGQKEVVTGKEAIAIDNQQFLIIPSGNCLMTERLPLGERYRSVLFFFSDDVLMSFVEEHQIHINKKKALKTFHVSNYDDYIQHFVKSLQQIGQANYKSDFQEKLLKSKLEEILLYLIEKEGTGFLSKLMTTVAEPTQRLLSVVEHNRLKRLNLKHLAFLANMSLSTFKREFQKHYKSTPMKWFREKRLEHVAYLMRTQNKRAIDLYEEAGYESLSNFIQAFKKKYGITPKQF